MFNYFISFFCEKQINMYLDGVFFHCSIECLTIAHDAGTFLVTVEATIDGVLKSSAVREFLFLVKVMLNIIRIPKRWWLKWSWYSTHYNSLPQVNTVQRIMQETKLIYNSSCFIIPYIVLYPSPSCCFFLFLHVIHVFKPRERFCNRLWKY